MAKKKGQKNKSGNDGKTLPPPADSATAEPTRKETKKNGKKGKTPGESQGKLSDKSSESKSVDTPSSNTSEVVAVESTSTTKLDEGEKKKKGQKAVDNQSQKNDEQKDVDTRFVEADSTTSGIIQSATSGVTAVDQNETNKVLGKREKKKLAKKSESAKDKIGEDIYTPQGDEAQQEEKYSVCSEVQQGHAKQQLCFEEEFQQDFPSFEFTTQQSRKKRKPKKGSTSLPAEEPPAPLQVLKPTTSKSQSHIQQTTSDVNVPQRNTSKISLSAPTEDFPALEAKVFKKQGQKKRPGTQAREETKPNNQKSLINEFQQLHVSAGDEIKKVPVPQALVPKTPVVKQPQIENLELTIPHRKTRSGTRGRPILIETNHLALTFQKLDRAVHYDVTITPSTPKKLFRKVMEEFRQQFYSNRHPAFDGTKNLYSSSELPFNQQISREVTIYEDDRPKPYNVVVKFANYVDLTPLKKFMNANPDGIQHMSTPQEVIQCLDIVLRSAPALTCLPVGRSYFTPPKDQILSLGGGMEMYYGFYQSAVIGWKPFLNIDVAHKAFPMCQNVIDLILELTELRREDLQQPLQRREEDTVSRFIRTLKVRYQLPNSSGTRREYRVNGLERPAIEAKFKPEKGPEITVETYFLREKKIVLKYPHMPCVWVGNKERTPHILLPAEFCTIVEGQVINRKMSEKLTSAMIKQAATSTKVRKDKIMGAVRKAQFNRDPCVREFGITVSEEFTKINARVLEPPALVYNGKAIIRPNFGAWRPEKLLTGVTLLHWAVIILDRVRPQCVEDTVKIICSQATSLGMNISQPQRPFTVLQLRYRKELQDLEEAFAKRKQLQLLLIVIPNAGPFYSYVKQAAELSIGCLTQCIRNQTVCRINPSTVINLLQKINAKLEGTNHVLNDRVDWMRRPFMIMGADVTHPSPDSKDKPSVAAVTASFDTGAFKYNICWRLQPPKVEIIEDLANITKEQLLYFHKSTNHKPERIIFFRDGVSEGQFSYVLNTEIQAIRRACTCLQPDGSYKPKITFLVVQKRHHTRFFPLNPQDASRDKNLNVPVGTCVDTEITHPTALDFCLVSHASIQGVARPTKYRVLWDDADMSEDELEQLAFFFCHMFSRCTRSVSYPAPTYYAHLAAARIMVYCETNKLNMNNLAQEQERLCIKECIIKNRPMFFV